MKHEKPDLPPYAKIRQMNRGGYDKDLANEILDAGLVAHCGFIHEGRPIVIPMVYARIDDKLYIHGASTTRIIKANKAKIANLHVFVSPVRLCCHNLPTTLSDAKLKSI